MIYVLISDDRQRLASNLKRFVKGRLDHVDDINYVKFDATNTPVQEIVDEANYLPLGYDHKVIAIDNPYYLLKEKSRYKIEAEQDYPKLVEYLKNPNDDTDLIFLSESNAFAEKSEVVIALKKNAQITEIKEATEQEWKADVNKYITQKLGVEIDPLALTELANRTAGNVALFTNEAKKLALYTNHITYDDVVLMVTRPLEDNSFLLFNHLMKGDNGDAITLFRDLKQGNVEPVVLISMLSNQFRLMNQVLYLAKNRMTNDDIANELKIKPGRAAVLRKYLPVISEKRIQLILEDLYNLDLQIKSGLVDRYYGFELFLINFKID